jgi:hypothetical protein
MAIDPSEGMQRMLLFFVQIYAVIAIDFAAPTNEPSHQDAVDACKELLKKIEQSLSAIKQIGQFRAEDGQDARAALTAVADCMGADASKFTLVFMGTRPSAVDVISLAQHVSKTVVQFTAWCAGAIFLANSRSGINS